MGGCVFQVSNGKKGLPWLLFRVYRGLIKLSSYISSLKLTFSHLKMDGWNTIVSFWDGLFSGAMLDFARVGIIISHYKDPIEQPVFHGKYPRCCCCCFFFRSSGMDWIKLGFR